MNDIPNRYSEHEYQTYAPDEHLQVKIVSGITGVLALSIFAFIFYSLAGNNTRPVDGSSFASGFISLVIVGVVGGLAISKLQKERDNRVAAALMDEHYKLKKGVGEVTEKLNTVANRIGEIKSTGNVVTTGGGSIVIIGSEVRDSIISVKDTDPLLSDAIQTISGAVELSGNKEAGAAWARFLKELSGDRDRSVLAALWDRVVKLVPDVTGLVESAAKIVGLFS